MNLVGSSPSFSKWWGRSASKVTLSPSRSSWRVPSTTSARAPARTTAVSRLPGSCIGGSARPPVAAPGSSACRETSARWPGSGGVSSSKRWPPRSKRRRAPARLIGDVLALVEAQQLRQRQLQPGGDLLGDRQGRAGLAALDLREHRRADAAALGQVAQRETHRLAQGANPRPRGRRGWLGRLERGGVHAVVRYHVQLTAIGDFAIKTDQSVYDLRRPATHAQATT